MLEDRRLLSRLKRGDRDALQRIYEKHEGNLLTLAANLLRDPARAEDVVQDVFIAFVRSAPTLQLRGALRAYLATAVANRVRDHFRKESRKPLVGIEGARDIVAGSDGPVQMVINNEDMRRLRSALEELPYEQREVIMLRVHAGMKFREIAARQSISVKTALSRYQYGLDKLRSMLNNEVVK